MYLAASAKAIDGTAALDSPGVVFIAANHS